MNEWIIPILSVCGSGSILLFFIKRFFDRRDKREMQSVNEYNSIFESVKASLETIRLLAYARMSEEIERLLDKGYATPSERRILDEMYLNYKSHGWNGDMDARLEKVYSLRTDRAKDEGDHT